MSEKNIARWNFARLVIAGNAVAAPVVRKTQKGESIATIRVAVNHVYNGNQTVEFWNGVTMGKSAENAAAHIKKGDALLLEGDTAHGRVIDNVIEPDAYLDDEGNVHTKWGLWVRRWQFLPGNGQRAEGGGGTEGARLNVGDKGAGALPGSELAF